MCPYVQYCKFILFCVDIVLSPNRLLRAVCLAAISTVPVIYSTVWALYPLVCSLPPLVDFDILVHTPTVSNWFQLLRTRRILITPHIARGYITTYPYICAQCLVATELWLLSGPSGIVTSSLRTYQTCIRSGHRSLDSPAWAWEQSASSSSWTTSSKRYARSTCAKRNSFSATCTNLRTASGCKTWRSAQSQTLCLSHQLSRAIVTSSARSSTKTIRIPVCGVSATWRNSHSVQTATG